MAEQPKKCESVNASGEPCGAWAEAGGDLCYPHAHPSEWAAANQRGGEAHRRNGNPLPPRSLRQPLEVVGLLEETINGARAGAIDLRVANTIGFLTGHLLRAIELAELDGRVAAIETALRERKAQNKEVEARRYSW